MAVTKVKFYTPQGLVFGDTTTQTTAFSNAAIANYLPTYTGNLVALTGSVVTTANISGSYFIGNGSNLSGINGANIVGTVALAATVTSNAQPNITSVGNLTSLVIAGNVFTSNANIGNSLNVSGDTSLVGNIAIDGWANIDGEANISNTLIVANTATVGNLFTTGNVTGGYILGNGAFLTGLPAAYSNANAASFLASFGSNSISTSGTLAVGLVASDLIPDGNVTRSLGNVNNQWKSLYVSNNTIYINNIPLSIISGNTLTVNGANAITTAANGLLNVSSFTTTGNIVSTAFVGNGAGLTDINANAVVGDIGNADSNVAGNVITANTANLDVANVNNIVTSTISANSTITASTYIGSGNGLSNIIGANVTGNVPSATIANTVTNNAQPNITSVGTLTSVSVSGTTTTNALSFGTGNIQMSGNLISTTSPNIILDPDSANGGITGNLIVTGNLQVAGNLTYLDVSTAITSNLVWQAANNANTSVDAHGGGLAVGPAGGSYASLTYSQPTNQWIASISVQSNGNLSAVGNVVGNNVIANTVAGNGAGLFGVPYSNIVDAYSNSNVASYLPTYTGNLVALTGNVDTTAGVSVLGTVTAGHLSGEGGNISNVQYTQVTGANANVTTLLANFGSNTVSTTGTITGILVGDGGNITNIQWNNISGANSGIVANIAALVNNPVSTTGNISAGHFLGEGGNISNIRASSIVGTVATANTVTDNAQPNITSVGTLSSLTVTANATAGNLLTGGLVSATGNITGNVHIGNGAGLTSLTGSNVTGQVANALVAGTVYVNAQPNITSVGVLSSVSVTGNANVGNLNVANAIYGSLATASQPNITSVGTLSSLAVAANIAANNISLSNNMTVGGNLSVTGNINLTGNVTQISGNSGQFFGDGNGFGALYAGVTTYTPVPQTVIQASANYNEYAEINIENTNSGAKASADYIATADTGTGNTYYADLGISSSNWDGSSPNSIGTVIKALDSYLYAQGGGNASAIGGNLVLAAPTPSRTIKLVVGGGTDSNIVAEIANTGVSVTGVVSATGNITGSYIIGNGSQLTGLPAGYTNANVTSFLAAFGSNVISTTGNITGSYITGNGSQLTGLPAGYSNANAAAFLASGNSTPISVTGNVSGANIAANGVISASGNITGNVLQTNSGFVLNPNVISNSFTIPSGYNASTAGPITLAANVVITISAGSNWVVG